MQTETVENRSPLKIGHLILTIFFASLPLWVAASIMLFAHPCARRESVYVFDLVAVGCVLFGAAIIALRHRTHHLLLFYGALGGAILSCIRAINIQFDDHVSNHPLTVTFYVVVFILLTLLLSLASYFVGVKLVPPKSK